MGMEVLAENELDQGELRRRDTAVSGPVRELESGVQRANESRVPRRLFQKPGNKGRVPAPWEMTFDKE